MGPTFEPEPGWPDFVSLCRFVLVSGSDDGPTTILVIQNYLVLESLSLNYCLPKGEYVENNNKQPGCPDIFLLRDNNVCKRA